MAETLLWPQQLHGGSDSGGAANYLLTSDGTRGQWVASIDASKIGSGTIATVRLGSGSANSGTWLRGDSTWQPLPVNSISVAGIVSIAPNDVTKFYRGDATFAVPPTFTSSTVGYVPASGGGTTNFLRADGTFAAPSGGFSNPMTTLGDLIVGGTSGTPTRFADVATGSYLASGGVGAAPSWATLNQAAVAGLTTASSPTFTGLLLSGLTASLPVVTDGSKNLTSQSYATFFGNLALTGDATSLGQTTSVVKIQGNAVKSVTPTDQQVLTWINANNRWEPTTLTGLLPAGTTNYTLRYNGSSWVANSKLQASSAGLVTIASDSSSQSLNITGSLLATGSGNDALVRIYNAGDRGVLQLLAANGSNAIGAQGSALGIGRDSFALSGARIGSINFNSIVSNSLYPSAFIEAFASENQDSTHLGTYIRALTTNMGSTSAAERLRIQPAGEFSINTTSANGQLHVKTRATTVPNLYLEGIASQTAGFLQAVDSGGTTRLSVVPGGFPLATIDLTGLGTSAFKAVTMRGDIAMGVRVEAYGTAPAAGLLFYTYNGSFASPTATQNGDGIGFVGGGGYGTNAEFGNKALFLMSAVENWSNTAQGCSIRFFTTLATTTTRTEKVTITDSGDLAILTAGKGLTIKEGTNAKMGRIALVGGTRTISTTAVTANSEIFITNQSPGGTPGMLIVSSRIAGTSFTILSSSVLDTSTVAWIIIEPS